MNKFILPWIIFILFGQTLYGQTCYNSLSLGYDPNIMAEIGNFVYKGYLADDGQRTGRTNRILIVDKDNLEYNTSLKICGLPQPNSLYENKCLNVAEKVNGVYKYDRKFIWMQVVENPDNPAIDCFSRDFVYIDIVDTKFTFEVLPNCGGIRVKNESDPFTKEPRKSGVVNLNLSSLTDVVQDYDYFPSSVDGYYIPIFWNGFIGDYYKYEFVVTNTTTNQVTVYPSVIGESLDLPNVDMTVELRIKGVPGKVNQVNSFYKSAATKTITRKACSKYEFYNTVYTKSGTYTHRSTNPNGCDSLITLNLTIVSPSTNRISASTCQPSYTLNGQTYTTSGTYTQTLVSKAGCDSTITLTLKVNKPTTSVINQTSCGNYVLNGQTYTTSGTYAQTLKNKAGCDSTITLNLKINNTTSSTVNQISCNPSFTLNGTTYTTGGNYQQTIPNKAGCDSVITLNLTFVTINTEIKVTTQDLTAIETNAQYKWFNCASPSTILSNTTSPIYLPPVAAKYGVTIEKSGCSSTSACVTFTYPLTVDEQDERQLITLTPNPTSGLVTLAFGQIKSEATVYLISALGQTVLTSPVENTPSINVDLRSFPDGLYHIYLYEKGKKAQSFSVVKE